MAVKQIAPPLKKKKAGPKRVMPPKPAASQSQAILGNMLGGQPSGEV